MCMCVGGVEGKGSLMTKNSLDLNVSVMSEPSKEKG